MLFMVIVGTSGDFAGAVDLFADDEAGEHVREDELAEAPDEVGAVARVLRNAEGAADDDVNFTRVVKFGLKEFSKFGRGELSATFVGDDDEGVLREAPFGEPDIKLFCFEESEIEIEGLATLFLIVFD